MNRRLLINWSTTIWGAVPRREHKILTGQQHLSIVLEIIYNYNAVFPPLSFFLLNSSYFLFFLELKRNHFLSYKYQLKTHTKRSKKIQNITIPNNWYLNPQKIPDITVYLIHSFPHVLSSCRPGFELESVEVARTRPFQGPVQRAWGGLLDKYSLLNNFAEEQC